MKIILPKFEYVTPISDGGILELQRIERMARICYKSEDRITEDGESAKKMVEMLIKKEHEAMIEHSSISIIFTTDRGVSHELVRHRLCSYAQESTRWCDYSNDTKFEGGLTFVLPHEFAKWFMEHDNDVFSKFMGLANIDVDVAWATYSSEMECPHGFMPWLSSLSMSELDYLSMRRDNCTPQLARSVLLNSLKTEIGLTTNYRELRNILKLRTAPDAHPDIRSLFNELLKDLRSKIPLIFDDIPIAQDI